MGQITMEKAMKEAMTATKLTDWGGMTFVENYKFVTDTKFFQNLTLTNMGYIIAQKELQILLRKRLRLVDYLKKCPQVTNVPIKAPIFVFGLGRSGTTFVHRLLDCDPKSRSPKLWELIAPVPDVDINTASPAELKADREKRNKMVRDKIAERDWMGQSAMSEFHEIGADLPEEDMIGVSADIPTCFQYLYTCLCQPQIFLEKIKDQRVITAYQRYKTVLQLLSAQTGETHNERRWILKFPVHILFTKELTTVFPDAKLIWAHRHPVPTVASLSAMMATLHDMYYDKETCDRSEVGNNMAQLCNVGLKNAMLSLDSMHNDVSHVIFNDLVNDPISVIKNIYKTFNMEYTQEFENNMKTYLAKNNAERLALKKKIESTGKKFDYNDPKDYGLDEQTLTTGNFADYLARFKFPSQL
jgi:hypothetical protein